MSGLDSPTEVVPLFVRVMVIVPTSNGKKTSGLVLTDDTNTSEDASCVVAEVLSDAVVAVAALAVAASSRSAIILNKPVIFFIIFSNLFTGTHDTYHDSACNAGVWLLFPVIEKTLNVSSAWAFRDHFSKKK
jgi:co-chaperonin GroES (HSP10)